MECLQIARGIGFAFVGILGSDNCGNAILAAQALQGVFDLGTKRSRADSDRPVDCNALQRFGRAGKERKPSSATLT